MGKKTKLPVVTINAKAWCRNTMHDTNGKCCALGFAENQISDEAFGRLWTESIKYNDKELGVATINDKFKGKLRRDLLTKLFKKAGVKLLFKN